MQNAGTVKETETQVMIILKEARVANAMANGEDQRSSKKERRVDALALRADERRDKLRKASGRSKYPLIRRSLNGETRLEQTSSHPYANP